jgi:hypothetical protein
VFAAGTVKAVEPVAAYEVPVPFTSVFQPLKVQPTTASVPVFAERSAVVVETSPVCGDGTVPVSVVDAGKFAL